MGLVAKEMVKNFGPMKFLESLGKSDIYKIIGVSNVIRERCKDLRVAPPGQSFFHK